VRTESSTSIIAPEKAGIGFEVKPERIEKIAVRREILQ